MCSGSILNLRYVGAIQLAVHEVTGRSGVASLIAEVVSALGLIRLWWNQCLLCSRSGFWKPSYSSVLGLSL